MTVAGFSFTKILVEKKGVGKGKVNISNNVSLKNAEEAKFALGKGEQKGAKFEFEFISKYEPDIGTINLTGDLLFIADEKTVSDALAMWKKDKKVPEVVMTQVINTVLHNSNIEALILSKDVGLPPPIPLPKVDAKTPKK